MPACRSPAGTAPRSPPLGLPPPPRPPAHRRLERQPRAGAADLARGGARARQGQEAPARGYPHRACASAEFPNHVWPSTLARSTPRRRWPPWRASPRSAAPPPPRYARRRSRAILTTEQPRTLTRGGPTKGSGRASDYPLLGLDRCAREIEERDFRDEERRRNFGSDNARRVILGEA